MIRLLRIQRQERLPMVLFLVVLLFFQYLIISKFWCLFANYTDDSFCVFMRNFHMSGFDPITYDVVTQWHEGYDILRHPLLALMMYPLYLVNQMLWALTGANCVQLVVGVVLVFCSVYSLLFVHRTLTEVIGIGSNQATLLSLMLEGFAYVLISMIVPDHFCLSFLCLTMATYMSGVKMKNNERFTLPEAVGLFTVTAGITLSNGAIVLGMIALTNGLSLLSQRRLVGSLVVVLLLMMVMVKMQKMFTPEKHVGQNLVEQQFNWTRQGVDKMSVVQANFFGESLQLHRKHILGDVLRGRPVVVDYSWPVQNAVTIVIEVLLVGGLICGIRKRFAWLLIGVISFNLLLHIVLAFAIDEVYIMAAHWAFVLPLAMAFLLTKGNRWWQGAVMLLVLALTIYLYIYHGFLLHRYLTWPLVK